MAGCCGNSRASMSTARSRAPASGSRPTLAAMRAATSFGATSRRATSSASGEDRGDVLPAPREPALLHPHLEHSVGQRRVHVDGPAALDRDLTPQQAREPPARIPGLQDREGEGRPPLHVVLLVEPGVADLDLPLADETLLDRGPEALAAQREPSGAVAEPGDDDLRPALVLAAPVPLETNQQVPGAARTRTPPRRSPPPTPPRPPARSLVAARRHACELRPPALRRHEVRDRTPRSRQRSGRTAVPRAYSPSGRPGIRRLADSSSPGSRSSSE